MGAMRSVRLGALLPLTDKRCVFQCAS